MRTYDPSAPALTIFKEEQLAQAAILKRPAVTSVSSCPLPTIDRIIIFGCGVRRMTDSHLSAHSDSPHDYKKIDKGRTGTNA